MAQSPLIAFRLPQPVKDKADEQAVKLGYVKPDGTSNLSEYIRNLIINDQR